MTHTILSPQAVNPDLDRPPVAPVKALARHFHGEELRDNYAWLRDPKYPEVKDPEILAYLQAENSYFEAALAPHRALTDTLFEELKGRIKEDDESVPLKDGAWLYQWRYRKGDQYKRWYRRPVGGGPEELILDEPQLAEGKEFFRLGGMAWSPNGKLLAYSSDEDGSERYTLHIKDLTSGELLADVIPNTIGSPVWAEDQQTLLYLELSDQWRPYRVRAHVLGTNYRDDPIVYEEQDAAFFVGLNLTQSRRFILISAGDHVTSEVRLLPTHQPSASPVLVAPRRAGQEYHVEHHHEHLYIRTNDTHSNFRIVTAPVESPGREHWQPLIQPSDRVYLRGLSTFADFMAIQERVDGLDQIRIRTYTGEEHRVDFQESVYTTYLSANAEYQVDTIRLGYESMVTPTTVYDYHVPTRQLQLRKVQEIPSGYDASQYRTERLMAPARDGAQVPVSVVYRKDFARDGQGPLHLYGYGAYGLGMSPTFSPARISLLDRGFAYAVAHVRGGDELGHGWYTAGKLNQRLNTFHDFIDVASFMCEQGYASAGNISISGGSAGGKLMGAVMNMAPHLWRAVVAHVPFVDVLNTMLDDSLPLTPIEWPEWGNPIADPEAFAFIRAYCPYTNVRAQDYPPLLITAGINDPRVTYWEPAKWAAKLRATKTDGNILLLKTNMGAGHGGKSGRFERLRETAEEYTFLLLAFGRTTTGP